jgi:hypothetical protein
VNRKGDRVSRRNIGSGILVTLLSLAVAPAHGQAAGLPTRTLLAPSGTQLAEFFGYAVTRIGDFNGDGHEDFAVGSPQRDNGPVDVGAAYIFFGGPGADNTADVILIEPGAQAVDLFGASIAPAGDVNGDGYSDVVVGATLSDTPAVDAGRAFVYFGGAVPNGTADWILTGAAGGDQFGVVGGGIDVNGDGYDDIVVGAPHNDLAGNDVGRAYVFYGGPAPDAFADVIMTGEAADNYFGGYVAGLGDVNGDGYGDWGVSATGWSYPVSFTYVGRTYVFYGGTTGLSTPDIVVTGEQQNESLGNVAAGGDVNGDGYDDILVGSPGSDPLPTVGGGRGRIRVLLGGPNADPNPDLIIRGVDPMDGMGSDLSAAGDVNGDGFGDILVGLPFGLLTGQTTGRAEVYFGGAVMDTLPDLIFYGETVSPVGGGGLGKGVGPAGDIDGDGFDDILVGYVGTYSGSASAAGHAYVFGISPVNVLEPVGGEQWVAGQSQVVRWSGIGLADVSVSTDGGATWSILARNVGGNQTNEVRVIAPEASTSSALVRVSYVGLSESRASSDRSDASFRIVPTTRPPAAANRLKWLATGAAGDQLGYGVARLGDFNGDGFADAIAGAPFSDPSGLTDAGRAYVYFGGPTSDSAPDLTLAGAAAGDAFGARMSDAGDFNGDFYPDLIVGAPLNDAAALNAGRAYLFFGGPGADASADVIFTGVGADDQFGFPASGIGDINGDGFSDVAVAAPTNDANGTNAGRVYVFLGGIAPNNVADLTLSGTGAFDQFGYSIAGADVNGDGYSDLVVAAPFRTVPSSGQAGTIYVYYGGTFPDGVADLTISGTAFGGNIGYSLAVSDFDGDGRSDILAGAIGVDSGTGRAYLIHGGSHANLDDALVFQGTSSFEAFGYSVAAGDVNGDRYPDAMIGAPSNPAGGSSAGKVYFFYGGPGADARSDLDFRGTGGSQFGVSVAVLGNLLGDGVGGDAIIGANGASGAAGRVYAYDFSRYLLTAPNGGESWQVGALKEVRWSGAEKANVWLSVDGGRSYDLLRGDVGGFVDNTYSFRVPHTPTKFGKVRVTPVDPFVPGMDETDSLFTIQVSVALLSLLAAPAPEGRAGTVVSWASDPGPEDLAGYRLERSDGGGNFATIAPLIQETSYEDASAHPGARYRLFAVNGLSEELLLGETTFAPRAVLAAWPLPYRPRKGGALTISFALANEVALYDVGGRLVRMLARPAGGEPRQISWDGRDEHGREVASGIYFLRMRGSSENRVLKVALLR